MAINFCRNARANLRQATQKELTEPTTALTNLLQDERILCFARKIIRRGRHKPGNRPHNRVQRAEGGPRMILILAIILLPILILADLAKRS